MSCVSRVYLCSTLYSAVYCGLPYPAWRRSAFHPFIVSLSFIELSKLLSEHRTFFGSTTNFFNRTIYRKFRYDIQHYCVSCRFADFGCSRLIDEVLTVQRYNDLPYEYQFVEISRVYEITLNGTQAASPVAWQVVLVPTKIYLASSIFTECIRSTKYTRKDCFLHKN